jgi:MEDS: MEthanogen/methylotroph, DcmR Sensory domain
MDRSTLWVFTSLTARSIAMTETEGETLDPVSFAGGVLDPYRHVCAFVNSRDEERRILDPFVTQGLERGEKVLYLVDSAERANLVSHLRYLGFDMPALLGQRRCEVRTWAETYLRGGRFDQAAMLGLLDEFLVGTRSPRIRMVADMGWAVGQDGVGALLIEFEARANFVHANHGHVVICVYDTAKFDGDFVIDILRTHPMALIGGVLQVNPFFVPPAEFLEELRSRDRRAPDV